MKTAQTKNKLSKFTRKNEAFVRAANKGINRKAVLSSKDKFRLPSARNSYHLLAACDNALKELELSREAWEARASLTANNLLLDAKYKDDPKALAALPHKYLNSKRLKVLTTRYLAAIALYEALADAYHRRTGKIHKPNLSEQVNKPLQLT